MAMFECKNCGTECSEFPAVLLAVNSPIKPYPHHHDNVFEVKWDEFCREAGNSIRETWKLFHCWLGNYDSRIEEEREHHLEDFCSLKCAVEFLTKLEAKRNGTED